MMSEDKAKPLPATSAKVGYTISFDEGTFRFVKPKLADLDRYLAKVSRSAATAGRQFTTQLCVPEDRERWIALLDVAPGRATPVVDTIMEDMGFMGEAVVLPN
jgi:hypothetical protein